MNEQEQGPQGHDEQGREPDKKRDKSGRRGRISMICALAIVVVGVAFIAGARMVLGDSAATPFPLPGKAEVDAGIVAFDHDAGEDGAGLFANGDRVLEVQVSGLQEGESAAAKNTRCLQDVIDEVSERGGGTVHIPAGDYYFAVGGAYERGHYAIEARNNVAIVGAGADETTLMPLGTWEETRRHRNGIDMFWFDGVETGEYLVNADFFDLTVDGLFARGAEDGYNASGKGFFFKLFRDCDWENVVVKGTDGTGFGVDFPIDCTIKNCIAIGCGKNATVESAGASGFGIGVGYSPSESILIEGCTSYDNTKYGFFFEHQSIFGGSDFNAVRSRGFVVRDCYASGNLYNFGGNRAYDVSYESCVSGISDDSSREAYTRHAYMLEDHTVRISYSDCSVEQSCNDVSSSDAYYEAVRWALDNGVVESGSSDVHAFRPNDVTTRGEAAVMLWRLEGWPGDLALGPVVAASAPTSDVAATDYCADAVRWLKEIGLTGTDEFRPNDPVTRAEAITLLWRLETGGSSESVEPYYAHAFTWAVDNGIMTSAQAADPQHEITRGEAAMFIYAYATLE